MSTPMFEREDWTLFRTVEGLQQKAGVQAKLLRRLVFKELGDNALDTNTEISFGYIGRSGNKFYVEDHGLGLDGTPDEIAALFSIRRPMLSSKLLRLPQRGALGNGLRVVAGAVLASDGSLAVITRNRRIVLQPRSDGHTDAVEITNVDHPVGTRIEIAFGAALPQDPDATVWIQAATTVAGVGRSYDGQSSPFWYDGAHFHELLLAYGAQPVRGLVAQLDGCTGGKAGEIVAAAGLERMACNKIERAQAIRLLKQARKRVRPVSPERLGGIGRDQFNAFYAVERGTARLGTIQPLAEIPFVVEAWAVRTKDDDDEDEADFIVTMMINRTPSVDELSIWRDSDKDLRFVGNGINEWKEDAPKKGGYRIIINVTTPYCPIVSDGKEPDLSALGRQIITAVTTAMRKAQRAAPRERKASQKDVVLAHLDEAIADASGDGEYRFSQRQIFYRVRPFVLTETGRALTFNYLKAVLTDYENEHGEIDGMFRDPRGSIYHPHRRDDIPLGTLTVEEYERPPWTFNKLVYIEKEGFSEALKQNGWPERNDCAVFSSKGYTTRAARDLVDKLAEHDEPVTIFCVHDADAPGTMIYQTFQAETKARGARKIEIVNLGLEPWEAIDDGREIEDIEGGDQRKPVATYVTERTDGARWADWLQTHRIELDVMTTPEFIAWLDGKMTAHGEGKLIPPDAVIVAEVENRLAVKVRDAVREGILRDAGFEDQVVMTLAAIERPGIDTVTAGIAGMFADTPEAEWRDHIEDVTTELARDRGHDDE